MPAISPASSSLLANVVSADDRNPGTASTSTAPPELTAITLDRLLLMQRNKQCLANQVWETLMNLQTTAGRELFDSCQLANPTHCDSLRFSMATLFCTPVQDRTLAHLDSAGIFVDPSRRDRLSPEDADLLLSDDGLRLWLRYAASPSAYPSVFVDAIMNKPSPARPSSALARALRVLVACGRDTTNDIPIYDASGDTYLPLTHLSCHVASECLPSLLAFGANANQLTASGVPLVASALSAQAHRLHLQGQDLLIPHGSLYSLGTMLQSHGACFARPTPIGSPPVVLLGLNGYCAAAEALLSLDTECCTFADQRHGNTLMHRLAAATRLKSHSFMAFFLLNLALRYGGDPDRENNLGVAAISLLSASLSQYLRLNRQMIAQARERASHVIAHPGPKTAEEKNGAVPAVSAFMANEAKRLFDLAHDPLLPHESLFRLAASLRQRGVNMTQHHMDGSPPVIWLAQRGFYGAAEALLAIQPDCNVPGLGGNTLMHLLAAATRQSGDATCADYMLNTALRYGGDPMLTNTAGHTALSMLSPERARFLRAGASFINQTRQSATRIVRSHHHANRQTTPRARSEANPEPMRHSAAAL